MRKFLTIVILTAFGLTCSLESAAQFKEQAFSQSYNDDQAPSDSVDKMFSFKEYFGGLAHKNELKLGTSFGGSAIFIGGQQIYNQQYWKLPIVYGGILGGAGAGAYFKSQDRNDIAKYCFIGAGAMYWATLLDGVINYKPADYPHPGKATVYSILCPGLGQAYNHEFWKLPIYLGGMACAYYFYNTNKVNYERFRRIYKEATDTEVPYTGPISAETALYYRDSYRRMRDYSVVAIAAVYLLQVIDANVFAFMHDFEVNDDLVLNVTPTVITPDNQYAMGGPSPAYGLSFGFRF